MTAETDRAGLSLIDLNILASGLTYKQFAQRTGIDATVLVRYRSGAMTPSYRVAEQIALGLGGVLSPWEIVVDCLRHRWDRDRGVVEADLFPRTGRAPVAEALDALWRTANTINASEWFREECEAVAERLLDAVETEARLLHEDN